MILYIIRITGCYHLLLINGLENALQITNHPGHPIGFWRKVEAEFGLVSFEVRIGVRIRDVMSHQGWGRYASLNSFTDS